MNYNQFYQMTENETTECNGGGLFGCAVGAVIGGCVGGLGACGYELYTGNYDWKVVAKTALVGATIGGVIGLYEPA
ncbi:hypothetical protein [Clostridium cellulovorans]|uniref:Bacteriocin class II with double-glycine leader peptide n=1 Tax=Clostridium cellulovorans (strain ATCC 35296 / DSM 3052 / OCM 3 / 743B) TaxID=573061 RepID=D9SSI5_CLOC7|nr:hypothetical protein [Clostridium cellulovorans]ADL50582.1 hypothetical protein Clocel_0812 [Clostridium cellulovorans 743B]